MRPLQVMVVAGCRPNFIKIAALMRAIEARPSELEAWLVHTGQHFDEVLSDVFFRELEIRWPDRQLRVEGDSHATQTASLMTALETVMLEQAPELLIVVGDVNSTLAATLVASKLGIPVAHVEAGLRSGDREMPEEINRVVTDALSDYLFVTEPAGMEHLHREGRPGERIFHVGNVMVDTLRAQLPRVRCSDAVERLGLEHEGYVLLTAHRPSNVDDPDSLDRLLDMTEGLQSLLPVVFPAHPRVRKHLAHDGLARRLEAMERLRLVEPLGYHDFLRLTDRARLVVTDSGGVQEETTALGVPCLTIRDNTERPVTIEEGTNTLVGTDPGAVVTAARRLLETPLDRQAARSPELWDGHAAERIIDVIVGRADEIRGVYPDLRAAVFPRPEAVTR